MGLRDRILRRLGGDEVVDPDAVIEAGLVELWESGLIIDALAREDIEATSIEDLSARYSLERVRAMARIMVKASDARRAQTIIEQVQNH
jgi:hypothetical protein